MKAILVSTALIMALTASTAFAVPGEKPEKGENSQIQQDNWRMKHEEFEKNPIKALEAKKEEILKELKEEKISKDKAEAKIKRIEKKIIEIKDFERLSLQQKKELLIKDCEQLLNRLMDNKKINQKDAELVFIHYVEKINNWDGSGYPKLHEKEIEKHH